MLQIEDRQLYQNPLNMERSLFFERLGNRIDTNRINSSDYKCNILKAMPINEAQCSSM